MPPVLLSKPKSKNPVVDSASLLSKASVAVVIETRPSLLLDIGETATFLLFGNASHSQQVQSSIKKLLASLKASHSPARLHLGWSQLDWVEGSEINPLDPDHLHERMQNLQAILTSSLGGMLRQAGRRRLNWLADTPILRVLLCLSEAPYNRSCAEKLSKPACIHLDAAKLKECLTPENFRKIPGLLALANSESHAKDHISLKELVGTLLILTSLAEFLGVERFYLMPPDKKRPTVYERLREMRFYQRMAHHEAVATILHERYTRHYMLATRALRAILPASLGRLEGRVKDHVSITDKLNLALKRSGAHRKLCRSFSANCPTSIRSASRRISDGLGFALTLSDSSPAAIAVVRDALIEGLKADAIRISDIENYRVNAPEVVPYFSDEDVSLITAVANQQPLKRKKGTKPIYVVQGEGLFKASGYTTTQMTVRLRNPQTGQFDLPSVELHVCGEQVFRFYQGADHLIYDIRQGKDIYKRSPFIRAQFEPEVQPLLNAIEAMTDDQFVRFNEYRRRIYAYLRRLEMGLPPCLPPGLPPDLPQVCHLDSLTRLSKLHRVLREAVGNPAPQASSIFLSQKFVKETAIAMTTKRSRQRV